MRISISGIASQLSLYRDFRVSAGEGILLAIILGTGAFAGPGVLTGKVTGGDGAVAGRSFSTANWMLEWSTSRRLCEMKDLIQADNGDLVFGGFRCF